MLLGWRGLLELRTAHIPYVSGAGGAEALGTPVSATAASSPAAQPSSVLTYTTAVEIFDQRFNLLLGAYVSRNYGFCQNP